jgi:molybdopterin-guanine dinucleotide biosynthesis protein A
VRPQPVFCLLRADLLESLVALHPGGGPQDRRLDRRSTSRWWCRLTSRATTRRAFFNANTLAELRSLET